jgi:hypothetical protein
MIRDVHGSQIRIFFFIQYPGYGSWIQWSERQGIPENLSKILKYNTFANDG